MKRVKAETVALAITSRCLLLLECPIISIIYNTTHNPGNSTSPVNCCLSP